jgi:(p)ppGpp synthase/HD superfamily hydrolase
LRTALEITADPILPRVSGERPNVDAQSEPEVEPPAFIRDSDRLARAFTVARRAHAGHTKGSRAYLHHPVEVAELLRDGGYGEATITVGLLHDVVEDSGATVGDVVEEFGPDAGKLVAALTEDPTVEGWEARKRALREQAAASGPECIAIYIADKLANLNDWRFVSAEVGDRAVEFFKAPTLAARIRAWHADLEMGERYAQGLAFNALLRRELEEFVGERPPGSALG